MNLRGLRAIVGLAMAVVMPVTQVHAQEVKADIAMLGEAYLAAVDADLNEAGLVQGDAEVQQDLSIKSATKQKKVAKVEGRLLKRLPAAEVKLKKQLAKMSDEEVNARLSDLGLHPTVYHREVLASAMTNRIRQSVPTMANDIVVAGGVLKYAAKTKKELRTQQESNGDEVLIALLLVTLLVVLLLYSGVVILIGPGGFICFWFWWAWYP